MAQYLDASGVQTLWGKVKGYVDGSIQALDSSVTANDGYALKSIVITDGKISAGTSVAIPAAANDGKLTLKVNGVENSTKFGANASSDVTIDLGNFDASGTAKSLIDALDASKDAGSGKFITGIKQENGVITAITTGDSIKNPNALTVTGNGTQATVYDGSAARAIDISAGANITVTASAGKITIAAADMTYEHPEAYSMGSELSTGSSYVKTVGTDSISIPVVKVDASGHVTADSVKDSYTLKLAGSSTGDGSAVKYISKVAIDASGNLDSSIKSADSTITASSAGIPTSAAVKSYVDGVVAGASNYLGTFTALSGLKTSAKKGDFMRAGAAIASSSVHAGDLVIAEKDSPAQTIDGTNWTLIHCEMDTDTTYTIATGDSSGNIKVTPSTGSAYNVAVKGLDALAYKAKVADADVSGTISDSHIASASKWNGKLDASQFAFEMYTQTGTNGVAVLQAQGDNVAKLAAGSGIKLDASTTKNVVTISSTYSYEHPEAYSMGSDLDEGTAQTPAFGGTFNVSEVKVDASGHVTGDSRKIQVTMPSSPATTAANGLMTTTQVTKLNGIAENATADSAIPTSVLNAILV